MRIALLNRRLDVAGGGTERDLLITAQILAVAGHQVTIYADDIRYRPPEFSVRRVAGLPLGRATRLLSFSVRASNLARRDGAGLVLSFARALDVDIMRSGGSAHTSYVCAARQWRGRFASAAMQVSPYHRAQIALERAGLKSPNLRCAIAVSELVRRDLMRTFALAPRKVVTLYNGVDLKRFAPNRDKSLTRRVRAELGIAEQSPAVAFVGHGFARKGLRFLIEAWPMVESGCYLIVAGADRAESAYRRLANRLGLGDRIIFLGARAAVERLFAAVDGLALPSLFEPFGNVVLEAMAAGLPALCSVQSGAAELIPRELRELVVQDPSNVEELAHRINWLLQLHGDASQLMRSTAEQYTWERHGARLLSIIDDLV